MASACLALLAQIATPWRDASEALRCSGGEPEAAEAALRLELGGAPGTLASRAVHRKLAALLAFNAAVAAVLDCGALPWACRVRAQP